MGKKLVTRQCKECKGTGKVWRQRGMIAGGWVSCPKCKGKGKYKGKPDPVRSKRSKSAREKGQRFEQKWVYMLRDGGLDPKAKRNLTETRDPDVDIETCLPWGMQVRSGEGVSIWKAVRDAEIGKKRRNKRWALGIVFETRSAGKRKGNPPFPPFVVLPTEDFVEFVGEIPEDNSAPFEVIEVHKAVPAVKNLIRSSGRGAPVVFLIELKERPLVVALEASLFLEMMKCWKQKTLA